MSAGGIEYSSATAKQPAFRPAGKGARVVQEFVWALYPSVSVVALPEFVTPPAAMIVDPSKPTAATDFPTLRTRKETQCAPKALKRLLNVSCWRVRKNGLR